MTQPTDAEMMEMIEWCEQASEAAAICAVQWGKEPDGPRWAHDAVMLRAIAARLRTLDEGR